MASLLGISGSPVTGSNTDRAVKAILRASGLDFEFIKLSQWAMEPCRACLGCLETNECRVNDDGRELAESFRQAQAFVIGCYTPYSSLDARTKTFMERMYCLRHQEGLNRGKLGIAVITSAYDPSRDDLPSAARTADLQIATWMQEEGMVHLGSLVLLGNVPCIRCGHGDECELSGVRLVHGPQATVARAPVRQFEDHAEAVARAEELGRKLRDALD